MTTSDLEHLNTAMKSLSMRRENLYRALTIHRPGSSSWLSNSAEIDSINESMESIEEQRTAWRNTWGNSEQEAS